MHIHSQNARIGIIYDIRQYDRRRIDALNALQQYVDISFDSSADAAAIRTRV